MSTDTLATDLSIPVELAAHLVYHNPRLAYDQHDLDDVDKDLIIDLAATGDEDEEERELDRIRSLLSRGWAADWTGHGDDDTHDVRLVRP